MVDASSLPLVTVIMPIRNEAAFIERSLGAVLAQDYLADWLEILIADGMSDDATRAIIRAMPGAERVRIIDNPRRIQAAAMNAALPHARGEIIVRVDGHTIIAPDYVRQCVIALQETGAHNVGGPMLPVGETPMGKAVAAAGRSPFAVPSAFHVSDDAAYTDTVYMGAWPRAVLERVGGFDERFAINEDYELNVRIRAAGGRIYFTPRIRSDYYGRQTLTALWRQYFRYGVGKVQTLRQHPTSVRPRQLVAPVFVLFLAGAPVAVFGGSDRRAGGSIPRLTQRPSPLKWSQTPATSIRVWLRALWLSGAAAYGALNLFFAWRVARRSHDVAWWRVAVVFLTIHVAWGLGFWRGLLRQSS